VAIVGGVGGALFSGVVLCCCFLVFFFDCRVIYAMDASAFRFYQYEDCSRCLIERRQLLVRVLNVPPPLLTCSNGLDVAPLFFRG